MDAVFPTTGRKLKPAPRIQDNNPVATPTDLFVCTHTSEKMFVVLSTTYLVDRAYEQRSQGPLLKHGNEVNRQNDHFVEIIGACMNGRMRKGRLLCLMDRPRRNFRRNMRIRREIRSDRTDLR